MSDNKTFYLTTPIFYPNAKLHLGHAYTTTLSDILVRYHRLTRKTYFLTGSDENTQKMVDAAKKEKKDPLVFLDEIVNNFSDLYTALNISYDQFVRTTDRAIHWPGAIALWKKLDAAGDIYKKEYEGLYCVGHESFITEKELVDGKCPEHGTVPERIKEENYFFRLSKYSDVIREKIETDELLIAPATRRHEILSFISEGLEDVSFSRPRKRDWPAGLGVPVPGDDSQIMYVWCDALANYITALGFGRSDDQLYKEFWEGAEMRMHVIGKDILRFHAAIWPGMLLSARLPLPKSLLVHGFITSGGKKMSKTLGNVIDPFDLLGEYGSDAVRYYLARHISPFEDGDITREGFKKIYNGELANGLGNVVSRVMKMAEGNLTGPVDVSGNVYPRIDYHREMETFDIPGVMNILWSYIQKIDQTIQLHQPFKLVKEDKKKGILLITDLVKEVYLLANELQVFMPETSEKIRQAVIKNKKPDNLFPRKE